MGKQTYKVFDVGILYYYILLIHIKYNLTKIHSFPGKACSVRANNYTDFINKETLCFGNKWANVLAITDVYITNIDAKDIYIIIKM